MPSPIHILVVDDDEITCNLLEEVLSKEGYGVEKALNGDEAIEKGTKKTYEVVLTDIKMAGVDGMEVLHSYRQKSPETIMIMMTAFGSIETAIGAIKEGAYDYVSKPFKLDEIKLTIRRALEQKRLTEENLLYRQELITKYKLENIVGRTPAMLQVYKTIARVADSRSTVFLTGESGTGKELVARAIHFNSPRAAKPFVAVDCGSLAETLLESELFGHVRGAFTGAVANKKGLFEEADGGTCFLDEVGDIGLAMQAKLLRVLQEHEIKRVGGTETIKIDVRIVAATNKNLEELVEEKKFREDLFYRLNVVTIHLPPLRERAEDIPLLAGHFLRKYSEENQKTIAQISPEAMELLSDIPLARECAGAGECDRTVRNPYPPFRHFAGRPAAANPRREKERILPRPFLPISLCPNWKNFTFKRSWRKPGGTKKRQPISLGIDRRTLYRMAARLGLTIKR